MPDQQHNALLDAVDALTKPRAIHTTITDDKTGEWLRVHTEQHPPLLELLIKGLGIPNRSGSSDIKIPIDAEALELWSQIRDLVRLWCRQLRAPFSDNLVGSVRVWFLAHSNAVRSGSVSEVIDHDVTRMVEGWVRMIENKFDPPEKREWKDACVANVISEDGETEKCGARRITIRGNEEFAISLNVTTLTAECRKCGHRWVGEKELRELRFLTNLDVLMRNGHALEPEALQALGM